MRRIGALIFPGFELLDLFGPMEMFGMLTKRFEISLVAERPGATQSNQGPSAHADTTFDTAREFDILFVPGGAGTRQEIDNSAITDWIADVSTNAEYILSVCTGSALLAKSGVLDGYRATTNKAAFDWVCEQGPNVKWVRQARWVEDRNRITSSGVSAGMDMTLGAISLIHGEELAEKVATWCEYNWQRDKNHDPFAKVHGLI